MGRNNRFAQTWKNQTEIGLVFGLSSIAVGKKLTALGLKGKEGPTQKALDEGYARATPLASGVPFYMWHLEKVTQAFDEANVERNCPASAYAATIIPSVRRMYDDPVMHKFAWDTLDGHICEVPPHLRAKVREIVEMKVFGDSTPPSPSELKRRKQIEDDHDRYAQRKGRA